VTVDSNPDRVLIVCTANVASGGGISSIKYNGVDMETITSHQIYGSGTYLQYAMHRLSDADLPVAGTYDLEITYSAAQAGGLIAFQLYNAAQVEEADNSHGLGYISSISKSITTLTDEAWIVSMGCSEDSSTLTWTHGSGQVELRDVSVSGVAMTASYEEKAAAGADTQSHTATTSCDKIGIINAAFAPAALQTQTHQMMI
jgi:hypothetical protein